ncbi:beta-glucuronidase [Levilactobacillus parabrevis]|uniref:Beta-glucuronidase n=1 Tax=Levilactobacillus parabrevis ATCC 53295 TaxID=1267003 RepID=A0A0R1GQL8_9LACO|nr:beta-glucuronidase [Levilactobacillus parabrevis]KRK34004.1 beta-D-glucuronidase [Levilactobacillus parabrevis ATCC 53295]KRO04902.1 beta-D-glucuronidase [Levilactobacillus parabrevis]
MLYPLTTETRSVLSLNGIWSFKMQADGERHDPVVPLQTTEVMAVPASFNDQTANPELRQHSGYFWYERDFTVPTALMDQRLSLRFGSATHEAWVFVNGTAVGHHKGGFTPFELPINDAVQAGTNRLTVKISNLLDHSTLPVGNYTETKDANGNTVAHVDENFDFFNYAGLHRNVSLLATPWNRVEDITVTPHIDLAATSADIDIAVKTTAAATVKVTLLDEEGTVVATANGADSTLHLDNIHLWQPLNAYLYQARVEILDDNTVVDSYTEPFGLRTIEIKSGKFLINGEPFYFKGFGKHEDSYVNGRGMNEAVNVLDLNLLKKIEANSFRTSHYPYSEEMMRLCDREGIVVIDEVPAVGLMPDFNFDVSSAFKNAEDPFWSTVKTQAAHEQALKEMIGRDKNHASVVIWSIANEPATFLPGAHDYFEPLFKLARSLDTQNRPCTYINIMMSTPDRDTCSDLADLLTLNRYYGWYLQTGDLKAAAAAEETELRTWQEKWPNKPIMFTEFGADTVAGVHSAYNEPFSEEYQVNYYDMNAKIFDKIDNFVGEQLWNFADFQTKFGINRVQGNKKGIFTRSREPKAAAIWLSHRWNNIPNFNYKK